MIDREFFSRMSTAKKAFSICIASISLLAAILSVLCLSVARLRNKLLRALDEIYRALPEIRFAAQLYIRENASEEEREEFWQIKGKRRARK